MSFTIKVYGGENYYCFGGGSPYMNVEGKILKETSLADSYEGLTPESFLTNLMEDGENRLKNYGGKRFGVYYDMLHKGMYHICRYGYDVNVPEVVIDYLNLMRGYNERGNKND